MPFHLKVNCQNANYKVEDLSAKSFMDFFSPSFVREGTQNQDFKIFGTNMKSKKKKKKR